MAESMSGILRPSSRFALQRFGAKVSSMPMTARVLALLTLLALASSCRGDDTNIVRGKGMTAADTLSARTARAFMKRPSEVPSSSMRRSRCCSTRDCFRATSASPRTVVFRKR